MHHRVNCLEIRELQITTVKIIRNYQDLCYQVLMKHVAFLSSSQAIWVVTFASVVAIKVDFGLLIGLSFSLATIIYRTQAPAAYVLGRVPGTDIYRNVAVNKLVSERQRLCRGVML